MKLISFVIAAIAITFIDIKYAIAAQNGYLIANIADQNLHEKAYVFRIKVKFDEKNGQPLQQNKQVYELSGGRYEILRTENVDTTDFDALGKTLMSTSIEFYIKKRTVHFLGNLSLEKEKPNSPSKIKIDEDSGLLKQVCESNPELLDNHPIRFINSNMPKHNFRFHCDTFTVSEYEK